MAEPGNLLGRYRIDRLLDRGATGNVYLAFDPVLQRTIAIKVLPDEVDDRAARERFGHELHRTAVLNHPNIVATYDVGMFGGAALRGDGVRARRDPRPRDPSAGAGFDTGQTAMDGTTLRGRRICAWDVHRSP
jgi:hypothetical protein